jgi:hypothetical protein
MTHSNQIQTWMMWLNLQSCEFSFLMSGSRGRNFPFSGMKNLNINTKFPNRFENSGSEMTFPVTKQG